ncbi:MAG: Spy/CpxP family protein refolding chaperone [Chromatiales bacterium]|nr:Spy/CpxP family protein refolding chaperone [Chromatiales bacterium]
MKRKSKIALIALVVVGITAGSATLVSAKGRFGGCGGDGPGFSQMGHRGYGYDVSVEDVVERVEFRLSRLKNKLDITAEQETAWNNFETAMVDKVKSKFETRQQFLEDDKVTVTERVEGMRSKATHLEEMATVIEQLYATLTPEQQEMADQFRMMKKGPRF